jgi:hypothetical protein
MALMTYIAKDKRGSYDFRGAIPVALRLVRPRDARKRKVA